MHKLLGVECQSHIGKMQAPLVHSLFFQTFFCRHAVVSPALAILAGIAYAMAFSNPFFWPIGWTGLALLYVVLLTVTSSGSAFFLGALFGLAAFCTGTSWVYLALAKSAGLFIFPPSASTAIFLFYLALFPATACALTRYMCNRSGTAWLHGLVFSALWTVFEILRGKLFGGFTVLSAGYLQIEGPLRGLAPIIGVYGLSWMTTAMAALAVYICFQASGRFLRLAVIAICCAAAASLELIEWTSPIGEPVRVRLLQPNLDITEKQNAAKHSEILDVVFSEITAGRADIILAPEAVIPRFWHELPASYIERLRKFARESKSNILLNITTLEPERGAVNNVLGILAENDSGFPRYEKFHLMPFGEYFPAAMSWLSPALSPQPLTPGAWTQNAMQVAGQHLGFMVCYEEMFGGEVIRWLPQASMLINPGNLSWVTGTVATNQFLQIARMRAMEVGRPVLRVPNNGNTAIIDHRGKLSASLPMSVSATLEGFVQGRQGMTPYSRWGDGATSTLLVFTFLTWVTRRFHSCKS